VIPTFTVMSCSPFNAWFCDNVMGKGTPLSMLADLEVLANQMDVPYQSLMKIYLAERIESERGRKAS
jgi:hypothetical protein